MENVFEKTPKCYMYLYKWSGSKSSDECKAVCQKKMNASLRNHVVVLSETLHSESVHSPPPPPLSHQWLRVRMTRIPLFFLLPPTLSLSLSLSSPSCLCLCFLVFSFTVLYLCMWTHFSQAPYHIACTNRPLSFTFPFTLQWALFQELFTTLMRDRKRGGGGNE